jgi:hypothetical protein
MGEVWKARDTPRPHRRSYAVTREGSRILFSQMIEQPGSNVVNVAVDWTAAPKK